MRRLVLALTVLFIFLACGPSGTPTPAGELPTAAPTAEGPASPTPDMLTIRAIADSYEAMTDLQWTTYAEKILGQSVRFAGQVLEVHDDGTVQIRGQGMVGVVLYGIPTETALTLDKGQALEGVGRVREVEKVLGLIMVRVDVEELE